MRSNGRVLLTGAAGGVGTVLRHGLRDHVERLVLLDRDALTPEHDAEEYVQADLRDRDAILTAVRDVDVVLHLGAIPVEAPFEDILATNLRGTQHVLDACRRNGVPRFVLASSHHVTGFYPRGEHLDGSAPPRPDSHYGVSKVFGEALGRMYHDRYGLEVVCVRIGTVISRPTDQRTLSTWCSPADTVRLFRRCIEVPKVGFVVIYGVSANQRRWWHDDPAAAALAYEPRDDAERYAALLDPRTEPPEGTPAARFQGGVFVEWEEPASGDAP